MQKTFVTTGTRARAPDSNADGNAVNPTSNLQFSCQVLSAMGITLGIPNWPLREQGWRYISIAIAQGSWETTPVHTCTIQSIPAKGSGKLACNLQGACGGDNIALFVAI